MTDQTLQRTDANYPFLRYADVILIMAEASNELKGPNDEAIGLLNDVRKRSNATPRELKIIRPNRLCARLSWKSVPWSLPWKAIAVGT